MILNLIQTNKELFAASFVICRGLDEIGTVSLQGKMGSMEASIIGSFYDTGFEMGFERCHSIEKKVFRPYLIKQDGVEIGAVYQTKYNGGLFQKFEFHQMKNNGLFYDLFPIDMGEDGCKCPIYRDGKQIAQVEKECVVYNDLHHYQVFASDAAAGLISVLFCLYMYVNGCYKPGEKAVISKSKTVAVTLNKRLKAMYNAHFKEGITE